MSRLQKRGPGPYGVGPRTPDGMDAVTAALVGLDAVAVELERKWGVGRLLTLCRDNARLSFRKGWTSYHKAAVVGDHERMVAIIPGLIRLWRIADAQATEDGHQPLTPDVWEAWLPDGRVLAIARTNAEAIAVQRSGRATVAYSMAEIARLLPKLETMDAVKQEFPGAVVEKLVQTGEGFAESWATSDPLHDMLHGHEVADA
jgi:hypothetical protein